MKLTQYQIKFEYITGIENTLANFISHLVEFDPDIYVP